MITNKIDHRPYPPSGHGGPPSHGPPSHGPPGHGSPGHGGPGYDPCHGCPPGPSGGHYPRPAALTQWHKDKPFRPPYYHSRPEMEHSRPSLNAYEQTFNQQFLDPPKPGGNYQKVYSVVFSIAVFALF